MLNRRWTSLVGAICMAIAGLISSTALAQDYQFESPVRLKADGKVIDTGKHVAHSGPAFADINEDGKTDLLVGNFRGTIEYFENTGTMEAPEYAAGKMLKTIVPSTTGSTKRARVLTCQGFRRVLNQNPTPTAKPKTTRPARTATIDSA